MSREKLPQRLLDVSGDNYLIQLAYDIRFRSVHIYLTDIESSLRNHYWFNVETGSFWPINFISSGVEPFKLLSWTSSVSGEEHVIIGGRDGILRRFGREFSTDDGIAIVSEALLGPIRLSSSDHEDGILSEMVASIAEGSGVVRWNILVADTVESAITTSPSASGVWKSGLNHTDRPRVRGTSFFLQLLGAAPWEIERITATRGRGGRKRLP